MNNCQRCGAKDGHLYVLSLIDQEGLGDGEHLHDEQMRLCSRCIELVSESLEEFVVNQTGVCKPAFRLPNA